METGNHLQLAQFKMHNDIDKLLTNKLFSYTHIASICVVCLSQSVHTNVWSEFNTTELPMIFMCDMNQSLNTQFRCEFNTRITKYSSEDTSRMCLQLWNFFAYRPMFQDAAAAIFSSNDAKSLVSSNTQADHDW